MNDLYDRARKRLAELRDEERTLNEFIVSYDRARRLLGGAQQQTLFDTETAPAKPPPPPTVAADPREPVPDATPARKSKVTDNPKPAVVVAEAVKIIQRSARPMSRRELHTALSEAGLVVKGADPIKALGTMLWRAGDKLVQLDGRGYWVKDQVFEPAGYDPVMAKAAMDRAIEEISRDFGGGQV